MDPFITNFLFWAFQALGGGFCFVLWIMFRDLKLAVETNAKELRSEAEVRSKEQQSSLDMHSREAASFRLHISENYVTQNELSKAIDALSRGIDAVFKKLDRIEEKLDSKQDKSRT